MGVFMSDSVFIYMDVRDAVGVARLGVDMGVALMTGTPEKAADFMRGKIGDDIEAGLELEFYPFEMMSLHH